MSSDVSLGYATFPDRAEAERICRILVEENLVACANVLAAHTSIYQWAGHLETTTEVAALLKFASTHREALAQRFRELHPYDLPALVYCDVTGGSAPFLEWIHGSSRPK